MKLIWKLLKQNINRPQLVGFFFANMVGMTIVLIAIQFYLDINPVLSGKETLFKDDYITVTKEIGLLNTLSSKSTAFTSDEIDNLKEQTFIKDVGSFVPSQYSVFAGINNQKMGVGFNTEMFFESVPDKFIDIQPDDWKFSSSDNTIPIILPKNYLDLYNFGFAEANGMPKITEGLVGMIAMDISIYGNNGLRKQMIGRVVGFSDRINTILVPQSFMTWSNREYGKSDTNISSSRLIVEVSNIADPNLAHYFKDKGYVISGDNTTASKMSFFLKIIVAIVGVIGAIICLLSFFILVLSIYLLLEKNMAKLQNLRLMGYSKSTIVKPYIRLTLLLNALIYTISLLLVFVVRELYMVSLSKLLPVENSPTSIYYTIVVGLFIFILLSIANIIIIRNKVK